MERADSGRQCPPFPPTPGSPIGFAARRPNRGRWASVRESGQSPDDPDGRTGACWHHARRDDCNELARRLTRDRDARRLTSVGLDCVTWMHARSRLDGIPQRTFLERFEPSRRWADGATPPLGLARAAVLYHLPAGDEGLTAAELFEGSKLRNRICPAEAEWLEAERRARLSFFHVVRTAPAGVVLRDWFGQLSGRRDLVVPPAELDATELRPGHTLFARIVEFAGGCFVDPRQSEACFRAGIADPTAPARHAWSAKRDLRNRTVMLETLFESWNRSTNPGRT